MKHFAWVVFIAFFLPIDSGVAGDDPTIEARECLDLPEQTQVVAGVLVENLCLVPGLPEDRAIEKLEAAQQLLEREIQRVRECRFTYVEQLARETWLGRTYGDYHGSLLSILGYIEVFLDGYRNIPDDYRIADMEIFLSDLTNGPSPCQAD